MARLLVREPSKELPSIRVCFIKSNYRVILSLDSVFASMRTIQGVMLTRLIAEE